MALSSDEVRIAWRALCDEALPDGPILEQLRALPSLASLRRMIVDTHAFQASLPHYVAKVPLDAPEMNIEIDADSAPADALLAVVRQRWHHLGVVRPHWAMTAQDEFLPERFAANQAAFEATGQAELDRILAMLSRRGIPVGSIRHVLDFGCGVGRISLPLARHFARVTGCDVSDPLLDVARAEAARLGVENLRFQLADAPTFGMLEPFDLWFSKLVLQHNPPPVMVMILRRMLTMLAPGGFALFQIPTYIRDYRFEAAAWLRVPSPDALEVHVLPQSLVLGLACEAECDVLEVREDASLWPPSVAISNVILIRKRRGAAVG